MKIDSIDLIRKLPAMIQGNKKFAKFADGGDYHIGKVEHWCLRFDEIVKAIEDYCDYKETGKYKLSAPVNGNWDTLNSYAYKEKAESEE